MNNLNDFSRTAVLRLDDRELDELASRMRQFLVDSVAATGGHLGAALGTVELTIALHRVFDSPRDVMVFDTGHQCYAHKILTDRAAGFSTLRQSGGLSGYPSRAESVHDWVENSHASVSLAWADGIAKAIARDSSSGRRVVAVIGDGALTGGVAWEGLNNLATAGHPVIVVINDNSRSYDPTVGGLAVHLDRLRRGDTTAGNLFESLGFAYLGPVDGHDIGAISAVLREATATGRAVVVHCVTAKGHGYPPAESDEDDRMHACGVIDPATGLPSRPTKRMWTDVFGAELDAVARTRPDVVALTAAMRLPTGLGALSQARPDAVIDSGIAEQHVLASAAGLATGGAHPVVALYSTFLHRAFDQLLLDVALHRLPVTVVLDRAGITGPDGPSHHGMWDLALLAAVPGMRIACPRDPQRLRELLREALDVKGPTALRYPKAVVGEDMTALAQMSGLDVLYRSRNLPLNVLLVSIGALAPECLLAAESLTGEGIGVTVVDPRWIWPINPALVAMAARHQFIVTVEDGIAEGGVGTRMAQAITTTRTHVLGLPTDFLAHAGREELLSQTGLTGAAIAETCRRLVAEQTTPAGTALSGSLR